MVLPKVFFYLLGYHKMNGDINFNIANLNEQI